MPIDINLFREEKGGNPEIVRESQRRRGASVELVDLVIELDKKWRTAKFDTEQKRKALNVLQKEIGELKKKKENADDKIAIKTQMEADIVESGKASDALEAERDKKLKLIGNLVHDSVPVSKNEDDNRVERTWGECISENKTLHHHEVLEMIDGFESERGARIAGHRAYFLKGAGVLLNQALINYGISYLAGRAYTPLQPPFFMNKEVMAETAQLEEFDEALYKVIGNREDGGEDEKYLIATSEQPISALYRGETLTEQQLPIRFAGISSCFRKEAGSYGRDSWGIFRVHQFEKVEQFCITTPETSWEMQEEMIKIAEEFYQSLGLSYRVINIVSGALNNAAARKLDLEAWFPALSTYRELVSCSNCLDYQSRAMETRLGFAKGAEHENRPFVHMLNATLCATERTICCILENYQTAEGVVVPQVLRPFMGGMEFIKFTKPKPKRVAGTATK
jgi:seryl-tRNA synthetase